MNKKTVNSITRLHNLTSGQPLGGLFIAACLMISALSCHAAVVWDLSGGWDFSIFTQNSGWGMHVDVLHEDLSTGTISGDVWNNPSWPLTGEVSGSSVYLVASFSSGSTQFYGTIAANGTLSGGVVNNTVTGPWTGSFWSTEGRATSTVPEGSTSSYGLFAACGVVLAMFGKRSSAQRL